MHHRKWSLVLLLCLLAAATGCQKHVAPPPATPAGDRTDASAGVPVVELRGSGAEMGTAHGQQLQEPIHLLFQQYLMGVFKNQAQRFIALTAASAFEGHLLPEHRDEVQSLASQTGIDQREIMLGQCFLDLAPMAACSTITLPASASPDGVARFGRNLDFPGRGVAEKQSVLLIYHPEGRYQFAAVGWPGMIGVLSGMNEHGLTLANMEVSRSRRLPAAMPYTLLYRTVLERCRTVDEAIALLDATPRQTANNLMLMDASGARTVVEITPEAIQVRRGVPGKALISTNHQRGENADTLGRCQRYDHLHETAAKNAGRIDPPTLESMLAGAGQGDRTLQSMIFEPSNRIIYLATGADAPHQTFHRIDLSPYFKSAN